MKWNNKTLLIILGVLAIISIVLFMQDRSVERPDAIFLSIDSAKVTEVGIKTKDNNVVLRREDTNWRMKQPKDVDVQQWAVQQLLKSFDTLEVEYVVTDDPAKFKDYQVDDVNGAHITVKTAAKTYEFIVGSLGPTWRHTHMRKPDDNKVYLVKGAIRSSIVKNPDDWRDRKIFVFSSDSCESLVGSFPDNKGGFTISREDTQWVVIPDKGKKFKPDDPTVISLLSGILRISVGEYVPDSIKPRIDYSQVLSTYHFTMKDGGKYGVTFYKYPANEQKVIFKVDGNDEPYTSWKSTYDIIGRRADDMTPESVAKKKNREAEGMKKAKAAMAKNKGMMQPPHRPINIGKR